MSKQRLTKRRKVRRGEVTQTSMLPALTRATPEQCAKLRQKMQAACCPGGWLWDNTGHDRPEALTTEDADRLLHLLDLRLQRHAGLQPEPIHHYELKQLQTAHAPERDEDDGDEEYPL